MVNKQVKYFLFGDITNNPAMNGLGWPYLTFLLDLYLGVESLCHEICIAPTLLNNANKLLKVSTFPSVKYECSNYSTSLPTCTVACFCFCFFFIQHVLGVDWYLTEILISMKILGSLDFLLPPASFAFDGLQPNWGPTSTPECTQRSSNTLSWEEQ